MKLQMRKHLASATARRARLREKPAWRLNAKQKEHAAK
jgi:hypothetical protein